jgi:rare lipoprotein A (peptidoglycan hydrolase)
MRFLVRISTNLTLIFLVVIGALSSSSAYSAEKGSAHLRVLDTQIGDATFYGSWFEGRKTASGRIFDGSHAIAAHRSYRFGTLVRVTNLQNRRSVNVVIVDRGPYGKNRREGAIIDLSPASAKKIGIIERGQARVKVEVLVWGNGE